MYAIIRSARSDFVTTPECAELIKYAQYFLAMKISYINEIASFLRDGGCEHRRCRVGIGLAPASVETILKPASAMAALLF
jgi:UDP-glucose 6-dehydrogenase